MPKTMTYFLYVFSISLVTVRVIIITAQPAAAAIVSLQHHDDDEPPLMPPFFYRGMIGVFMKLFQPSVPCTSRLTLSEPAEGSN